MTNRPIIPMCVSHYEDEDYHEEHNPWPVFGVFHGLPSLAILSIAWVMCPGEQNLSKLSLVLNFLLQPVSVQVREKTLSPNE